MMLLSLLLKLKVTMEVNSKKKGRDPFFDPFFDSFFKETKTKFIFSGKKKIKVNELPKPLPKNFTGGIGLFTLNHKVDSDSLKLNEGLFIKFILKVQETLDYSHCLKLLFLMSLKFSLQS